MRPARTILIMQLSNSRVNQTITWYYYKLFPKKYNVNFSGASIFSDFMPILSKKAVAFFLSL